MVKVKEDMTGWIMSEHGGPDSRLTVIRQVEDYIQPNGVHRAMYLCKCECGNDTVARGDSIKDGSIKSCGCLQINYHKKHLDNNNTIKTKNIINMT